MRHRYYRSETGRFIQREPLGWGEGGGWYQYVGGNPVNYSDPSGLWKLIDGWRAEAESGDTLSGLAYKLTGGASRYTMLTVPSGDPDRIFVGDVIDLTPLISFIYARTSEEWRSAFCIPSAESAPASMPAAAPRPSGAPSVSPAGRSTSRVTPLPFRAAARVIHTVHTAETSAQSFFAIGGGLISDIVATTFFVWAMPGSEYAPFDITREVWRQTGPYMLGRQEDHE